MKNYEQNKVAFFLTRYYRTYLEKEFIIERKI